MHRKKTFFLPLLAIVLSLFANNTFAQKILSKHVEPGKKDEPIEINSSRMRSEEGGKKIVFSGNVIGHWGDLEIISDVLEVYSTQEKGGADEVVAIGNVSITRGLKKAKGDRAVYIDKEQKIILTGKPKAYAWEGKNMIEGLEMIFLLDTDRFVVNDRVYMKIFPKDKTPSSDSKNPTAKSPPPAVALKNQTAKTLPATSNSKTENVKPVPMPVDTKTPDSKTTPVAVEPKNPTIKPIPTMVDPREQNLKTPPTAPNESANRAGKK